MPVYAVAKDITMVAVNGSPVSINSDPIPVGDSNSTDVVLNAKALFAGAGTPTLGLGWTIEGSNDGVVFSPLATSVEGSTASAGVQPSIVGSVQVAFIRFVYTLTVTGSAGDWGVATFDLHANLMRN